MDIENALLSFLAQQRELLTDNRPLRLRLDHAAGMMEDVLLPQRIYGSEAICGGIEYRVLCVSLNAGLPLKELVALPAALDIVTDTGDLRSVCGIVTEASAGDSDGGLASYQLLIQDAFAVMENRVNTRVFRNMSEVEIACALMDEWRSMNAVLAACFEFEMDRMLKVQAYPRREFTMQYNESDAAFIRRLLRRRGVSWCFRPAAKDGPAHKVFLFNSCESLPESAAGIVRFHRDAATEEYDTITSWSAMRTLGPGGVGTFSWDYKAPQTSHFMSAKSSSRQTLGQTGRYLSVSLRDTQVLAPHLADSYDDLRQLGELAMSRHDYESKCFEGEGSVRAFRAGEHFTLDGHAEIDRHPVAERKFVIISLEIAAQNNLPTGLTARVERLFASNRWDVWGQDKPTRSHIRFKAVRYAVDIVPAFDARRDVPQVPVQSALVVGPQNETVYCDDLGRVRVRFPGAECGGSRSDHEKGSAWIRVASNWAGPGPGSFGQCGAVTLPRVGSEVLVAFMAGDPDKPVIIGQLFNARALPPALKGGEGLRAQRYISGIGSQEVAGGSRTNRLRFDDTEAQISTELMSDHGNSSLSLGYLTCPQEESLRGRKGEGADLRSELAVAVRGEGGLLLTAESGDLQLEREMLKRCAGSAAKLCEQLARLAEKQTGVPADSKELAALNQLLSDLEETGSRLVALSAPEGLMAASGDALALSAGSNVEIVSQKDTRVTSAGRASVNAAKGVSLFAQRGGANVVAAAGQVQIKAQTDELHLLARKVLDIISTTDWINITAKQGVRIHGGGSELTISADGIKGCTLGNSEMRAAEHKAFKGRSAKAVFPGAEACPQQSTGAAQNGGATVGLKG